MKSVSSAVAIAFSRSSSFTVLLKPMFSRSVRLNMVASWNTNPTCWWSVVLSYSLMFRPSYSTVPDVGVEEAGQQKSIWVLPAAVGPITAVFVPASTDSDTSLSASLSPNFTTMWESSMSPRRSAISAAAVPGRGRGQHRADARVRGAGLRHHVGHEADHDDRENENREIAVERREVAEAHGPAMTKRPPSVRIISVARLVQNTMIGIRLANSRRMRRLMSRASVFAARNLSCS